MLLMSILPVVFCSSEFVQVPANLYESLPFCDNSSLPMTTATVVEYVTVMPEGLYKTSQQPEETGQVSGHHKSAPGIIPIFGITFLILSV
jgi:hypothetical protein